MASWIVIEGDNGTGKDTLAEQIMKLGYDIVSYTTEARNAERAARTLYGEDRVLSFLEYNLICGSFASSSSNLSLLIRYWMSTMAAAYADQIWTWKKVNEQVIRCVAQFPVPDLIILMECELTPRTNRIIMRGESSGDNMCVERDKNYRWALDEMSKRFPSVEKVDTTLLSPLEVFLAVEGILKRRGL